MPAAAAAVLMLNRAVPRSSAVSPNTAVHTRRSTVSPLIVPTCFISSSDWNISYTSRGAFIIARGAPPPLGSRLPQPSVLGRGATRRHVLERRRRDLADALAGDERLRVPLAREPLRDAQHQASIDHDAQVRRHREHDLLLQIAERHERETRALLITRQDRRDLAHLLLRRE